MMFGLWRGTNTNPIVHFLLCGRRQSNWPPLFGPFRSVDGKGVFGVIEHRDQDGDLIDEGVEVLDRVMGNTGKKSNRRNK